MGEGSAMTEFAVVAADAAGVITSWDAHAERLFGHPAAAAIGQTLDVIVPESHHDRHWTGFRALMSDASGAGLDRGAVRVPVRHSDGSVRPCAVRLMLLRDPWDRPVGALAVFSAEEPPPDGQPPLPEL
jgi:PAS domain S-box-containing protein